MFRPNFVFGFQERLKNPEILAQIGAQIAETVRADPTVAISIAQFSDAARQNLSSRDTDALARYAATSYAGVLGVAAQLYRLRSRTATHSGTSHADIALNGLDGATYEMPADAAMLALSSAMHLIGLEMRDRPKIADVSGSYALGAIGDCPKLPAHILLRQRDFVIEAHTVSDASGSLALYGAVGETRFYLVANEDRHPRLARVTNDAPIDLSAASVALFDGATATRGTTLELDRVTGGTCKLRLSPAT